MWVTCYADASFARKAAGGWGVWLRSGAGRALRRGTCPSYVRDSNAAELAAIYAGIYLARRIWPSTTGVLVCSDCQAALAAAELATPLSSIPAMRRLQQRLRELAKEERLEVRCKWVKGHQHHSASTSAWLNTEVDRLARSARRAARGEP